MAPLPPFSGVGNDLVLPVVPANYVTDIEGNFDKCRDNIIDVYNYMAGALGPASGFNPFLENGQLEVNGNFLLHRRMQEVARTVVWPVNGHYSSNGDYLNVGSGAGLGLIGAGTYSYHPTMCPGWYGPRQMMPAILGPSADAFGTVPAAGDGMQMNIQAGARLFNANDEAVFFQPVSVHVDRTQWAGRPLRIQIEYETDAAVATPPEVYAAWDVSGVRTVASTQIAPLPYTGLGTRNTVTLDVTPDTGANYLEVGIRVNDPAAHTFIFRRFIVSSNPQRSISTAFPGMLPVEQTLIERTYFRSVSGRSGVDHVGLTPLMPLTSTLQLFLTPDQRRPFITPTLLFGLGKWSSGLAQIYARPVMCVQLAPVSGALFQEMTNGVSCDIVLNPSNQGGFGAANYRDWRTVEPLFYWTSTNITAVVDFNPTPMLEYHGEVLTTFKPFLTT